ncbi:hypothetical protein [Halobacterium wangiae]|nr:hypothetical protein [Halobacterium wangiae]
MTITLHAGAAADISGCFERSLVGFVVAGYHPNAQSASTLAA